MTVSNGTSDDMPDEEFPIEPGADLNIYSFEKLERSLRREAAKLSADDAWQLVRWYDGMQKNRISANNQVGAAQRDGREAPIVRHFAMQFSAFEESIPPLLGKWAQSTAVGEWAMSQIGIGPVLAARFLSNIREIDRYENISHLWSYAGQNPEAVWEKGQKRPWNARLKVAVWLATGSFVKFHNNPNCYYGHLYRERKAFEVERNERGGNATAAAKVLETRKIQVVEIRAYYEAGKLPPGHLDARARRYAGKRFLSHWWMVAQMAQNNGELPSNPYVQDILGHSGIDQPPNWPLPGKK